MELFIDLRFPEGLLMCVFFSVEMVLEAFCELADLRPLSAQGSVTTFHFKFIE